MQLSEKDISQLKALHSFLSQTFKGSSFGSVKIDDCAESLKNAIDAIEAPAIPDNSEIIALLGVMCGWFEILAENAEWTPDNAAAAWAGYRAAKNAMLSAVSAIPDGWIAGPPPIGDYAMLHIPLREYPDYMVYGAVGENGNCVDCCGDDLGYEHDAVERHMIIAAPDKEAKRSQPVVKLPKPDCTFADHSYPAYSKKAVIALLDSVGVSIKPDKEAT